MIGIIVLLWYVSAEDAPDPMSGRHVAVDCASEELFYGGGYIKSEYVLSADTGHTLADIL